jgi:hypothetical protein
LTIGSNGLGRVLILIFYSYGLGPVLILFLLFYCWARFIIFLSFANWDQIHSLYIFFYLSAVGPLVLRWADFPLLIDSPSVVGCTSRLLSIKMRGWDLHTDLFFLNTTRYLLDSCEYVKICADCFKDRAITSYVSVFPDGLYRRSTSSWGDRPMEVESSWLLEFGDSPGSKIHTVNRWESQYRFEEPVRLWYKTDFVRDSFSILSSLVWIITITKCLLYLWI